jgi:CO dehydrogenase/acetyl-CoA synthase alpha subunit
MALHQIAAKLSPEQYEKNFADITPRMTRQQAAIEAARCLYCFDAPCTQACPTRIDVPAFIKKIFNGNLRGSAGDPFGEHPGRELRTGVPDGGAVRGRVRDA